MVRSLAPQAQKKQWVTHERVPRGTRGHHGVQSPVVQMLIMSFLPCAECGGTGKQLSRVPGEKVTANGTL